MRSSQHFLFASGSKSLRRQNFKLATAKTYLLVEFPAKKWADRLSRDEETESGSARRLPPGPLLCRQLWPQNRHQTHPTPAGVCAHIPLAATLTTKRAPYMARHKFWNTNKHTLICSQLLNLFKLCPLQTSSLLLLTNTESKLIRPTHIAV